MFLNGEHKDDENQLGGKEHLNEQAPYNRCPSSQFGGNVKPLSPLMIDSIGRMG